MSRRSIARSTLVFAGAVLATAAISYGIAALAASRGARDSEGVDRVSYLETRAGEYAARSMRAEPTLVRDAKITGPVRAVLDAAMAGIPPNPYTATLFVVDSGEINAFCMPGGVLVVDVSLIAVLHSGEELAAVFAHELSHMVHEDAWKAMKASFEASVLLSALGSSGGASGAAIRDFLKQAAFLGYSRSVESRADEDAVSYLAAAGIAPASFASALGRIRDAVGGNARLPEILSSHPDIDGRIAATMERAADFSGESVAIPVDWQALRRLLPSAFSDR